MLGEIGPDQLAAQIVGEEGGDQGDRFPLDESQAHDLDHRRHRLQLQVARQPGLGGQHGLLQHLVDHPQTAIGHVLVEAVQRLHQAAAAQLGLGHKRAPALLPDQQARVDHLVQRLPHHGAADPEQPAQLRFAGDAVPGLPPAPLDVLLQRRLELHVKGQRRTAIDLGAQPGPGSPGSCHGFRHYVVLIVQVRKLVITSRPMLQRF